MKLADLQKSKLNQYVKDVVFTLRASIKNTTHKNLPSSGITFDSTINGEVQIPEQLTQFFTHHVVGPEHSSHESASKIRRVESLAVDTVFSVTNGTKKHSKHLKLGIAVTSMTRSKNLIGMLNKYGYCVSYTKTEELEMELTFTVTSPSKISPLALALPSSLTIGIAYDQFLEVLSGKGTLHNRVGIVYQSVLEKISRAAATALDNSLSASGDSTSGRKRRRRTFKSFGVNIKPYHKKTNISSVELMPLECTDHQRVPESYHWQNSRIYCG